MHSDESIEPRFENTPSPALAAEAWRAEVASRVCSYRARRRRRSAGDNSPALDFGPDAAAPSPGTPSLGTPSSNPKSFSTQSPVSQNIGSGNHAAPSRVAGAEASNPAQSARHAIDTNYYRRLNAESMTHPAVAQSSATQSSAILMGATVASTAPAQEQESEFWVINDASNEASREMSREVRSEQESDPALLDSKPDTPPDAAAHDPVPCHPALGDPAMDLEIRPTVTAESSLDRDDISVPEPAPERAAVPVQGNLIVFPRALLEPPLLPQPSRDELAEPMHRRPRILEVPEDIMPVVQGSLFPEIRLDGDKEEDEGSREPEIESPLQVAPLSARLTAGLTDWGVVMAASLLFAAIAYRALPDMPHAKPFWMLLGAVTLLLWAVYQHLFLLYAGRTLGMSLGGIRLRTFDGQPPPWKQRGRRARFMFISFAAVALGFLWALVDEDALCWHDRISHTFPTTE